MFSYVNIFDPSHVRSSKFMYPTAVVGMVIIFPCKIHFTPLVLKPFYENDHNPFLDFHAA